MVASRQILIVAKETREAERAWKTLAAELERLGLEVWMEKGAPGLCGGERLFDLNAYTQNAELLVVVGGDGTFLGTARAAVPRRTPLLGINLGTLGFLTEFDSTEIESVAALIYEQDLAFQDREVLLIHAEGLPGGRSLAINDTVVNKNALSRMVDVEIVFYSGDSYVIRADGLIVSSPTGSTAYNLSAGGPIVSPDLSVLVLSPICPHGLGYRPLVVRSDQPLLIRVRDGESIFLTLDGQVGCEVYPGQDVRVERNPIRLRVAVSPHHDFLDVLRRKLGWGQPAYRSPDSSAS